MQEDIQEQMLEETNRLRMIAVAIKTFVEIKVDWRIILRPQFDSIDDYIKHE